MSEPDSRFEVPPEYADVYEQAFRRASNADPLDPRDTGPSSGHAPGGGRGPWRRAVVRAGLALVLVGVVALLAFGLGRASAPADPSSPGPRSSPDAGGSSPGSAGPSSAPSRQVRPLLVSGSCAEPSVSGARGDRVSFAPGNVLDGDDKTGWACAGAATGQKLVLTLPPGSRVSTVGLLPTTQVGGVAMNRILSVEWILDDGTTVRQDLPDQGTPIASFESIPLRPTDSVTLRIMAVRSGPADLTGISSVFLAGPTD